MNDVVLFFAGVMVIVMSLGLIVTISALCVMLVRSIYRDWDRM
jgi:hypothetical protein